jgi:hypothetical protein
MNNEGSDSVLHEIINDNYNLCFMTHPETTIKYDLIRIEVKIFNNIYKAILDTGASVNIIYSNIVNSNNIDILVDSKSKMNMRSLNGFSSSIGNIWSLDIEIGTKPVPVTFIVMEEQGESAGIILGLPFMYSNNVVMDFKHNRLVLKGGITTKLFQ